MKILITSALLYSNGELHPGHVAGAYLPADVYARFERLRGNDVLYISGSDEYGIAITLSAELEKRTPKEQVDHYHKINTALFEKLGISFDHYSRTTWPGHVEPVHQYFRDLLENGFIEEKVTDQLYSEEEDRFLADRYVVGECPRCGHDPARGDECPKCGASFDAIELKNPRSKLTGSKLTKKPTKHWFLLLDKMKDRLLEWLSTKNWKLNVVNFIKDYIEHMHPRAITRDMKWGVPIPLEGTEGKVLYVWFDAPIGYISATKEWAQNQGTPDRWKDYWLDQETKLVHFIGKDNIPFHAAIFPAMTMGQNTPYKLVDEIPANEFYNYEGRKFSKSEGWTLDIGSFIDRYSVDQLRYAIAANAPETTDSEFTWHDFQVRSNAELLGKYGNLVNRVLVFASKQCDGEVPTRGPLGPEDEAFLSKIHALSEQIADAYSQYKLRRACRLIMELAQEGNVYFDQKKPWVQAKEDRAAMETTISCCLECLKLLALTSLPIIPTTAEKVLCMLGVPQGTWEEIVNTPIKGPLEKPVILFRKIEDEEMEKEMEVLEPKTPTISIDDFAKVDLRVGEILACEEVPKSKKLYKFQVDVGGETRTILSGIKQYYGPEDLIGKKVIVVANLAPAKLMGIESQGMILAASAGDALEVVQIKDISSGGEVR